MYSPYEVVYPFTHLSDISVFASLSSHTHFIAPKIRISVTNDLVFGNHIVIASKHVTIRGAEGSSRYMYN